ncbi:hypothetical protein [Paenibacillus periandrae]|uniref:hypothetical protein n=1 Tax=Paenibacillus periandrae TaxID=1761741 RepID=UPI001F099D7D|nr:hypothetical protein [Paenibacillus periandrae]
MKSINTDENIKSHFRKENRSIHCLIGIVVAFYSIILVAIGELVGFMPVAAILLVTCFILISIMVIDVIKGRKIQKELKNHREREIQLRYGPEGPLFLWSDVTYQFNHRNEYIPTLWELVKQSGMMPPAEEKLVIAGPSASKGRYERDLCYSILHDNRYNNIVCLLSDLYPPNDRVQDIQKDQLNLTYHNQPVNALHLKNTLRLNGLQEAHIIWDFKGFLWNSVKEQKLAEAFQSLTDSLAHEGIIVLDAYKQKPVFTYFNLMTFHVFNKISRYPEESTYLKIQPWLDPNPFIQDQFNVSLIGEGKY